MSWIDRHAGGPLAVPGPDRGARWRHDGVGRARGALRPAVSIGAAVGLLLAGTAPGLGGERAARLSDLLRTTPIRTLDGRVGRIDPAGARASVVHFWASWCGPCKKELPLLDAVAGEMTKHGVRFAAISIDSDPKKAARFAERLGIGMPVFLDGPGGLAEALALPAVPCTFVLDPSGRVTFATTGSSEEEVNRLRAHLREAVRVVPSRATVGESAEGEDGR